MNWFDRLKIADSPYYRYKAKGLANNHVNRQARQLFEYIKRTPRMTVTLFHGTTDNILEFIQRSGSFTAPTVRKAQDREARRAGLDEVFFTSSIDYAFYYADRSADQEQENTKQARRPVIVQVEMPLYFLKEVSDVILGTEDLSSIYNEFNLQYRFNDIVQSADSMENKADQMLQYFVEQYSRKVNDEFTVKYAVPSRFISKTTLRNKDLMAYSLEHIQNHPEYKVMQLIPDEYMNDPQVQKAIQARESKIPNRSEYEYEALGNIDKDIRNIMLNNDEGHLSFNALINTLTGPKIKKIETHILGIRETITDILSQSTVYDSLEMAASVATNGSLINQLTEMLGIEHSYMMELSKRAVDKSLDYILNSNPYGGGLTQSSFEALNACQHAALKHGDVLVGAGLTTPDIVEKFVNLVKDITRKKYLLILESDPLNYADYQKKSGMPEISQDPEAFQKYKTGLRTEYLHGLLASPGNEENQRTLAQLYDQPVDISQDSSDAKHAYILSMCTNIKRSIGNKVTTRRRRRSFVSEMNMGLLPTPKMAPEQVLEKVFESVPEWALQDPELVKIMQNTAEKIVDDLGGEFDPSSIPQQIATDPETGQPKDYTYNLLKKQLVSLSAENSHRTTEALQNVYLIARYPDLTDMYKQIIAREIEKPKEPYQTSSVPVIAYRLFSGAVDSPFAPDRNTASIAIKQINDNCLDPRNNLVNANFTFNFIKYLSETLGKDYNIFADQNLKVKEAIAGAINAAKSSSALATILAEAYQMKMPEEIKQYIISSIDQNRIAEIIGSPQSYVDYQSADGISTSLAAFGLNQVPEIRHALIWKIDSSLAKLNQGVILGPSFWASAEHFAKTQKESVFLYPEIQQIIARRYEEALSTIDSYDTFKAMGNMYNIVTSADSEYSKLLESNIPSLRDSIIQAYRKCMQQLTEKATQPIAKNYIRDITISLTNIMSRMQNSLPELISETQALLQNIQNLAAMEVPQQPAQGQQAPVYASAWYDRFTRELWRQS